MQYLNTNHTLYDAVRKAEQENHLLMEEAQRVAHYLRVDFERGVIHLSVGMFFLIVDFHCSCSQYFLFLKIILSFALQIN